MSKFNTDQERDAVDFVTNSMYSLGFLKDISDVIFSPNRDKLTVGQFYDRWLQASGAKEPKIPFNLGAILGYIYCGVLFTKEHWFDLLPDVDFDKADPEWGFSSTSYVSPQNPNPDLKYVVRRIRNALGHGHVVVDVPKDLEDKAKLMTRVTLRLHDVNMRDASDTFDITLRLQQLAEFIQAFQSIVHQHVRSKT